MYLNEGNYILMGKCLMLRSLIWVLTLTDMISIRKEKIMKLSKNDKPDWQTGKERRVEMAGPTHKGFHFVSKKQTDMCLLGKKGNISLITKVSSLNPYAHKKSYLR